MPLFIYWFNGGSMEVNYFEDSNAFLNNLSKSKALLITKNDDNVNAMQIGWGYMGYMWKKPSLVITVRHSRYSYELLRKTDEFVVSIPESDDFKEAFKICGTKSGRDVNKIEMCGFNLVEGEKVKVPHIKGCLSYECKITYKQAIDSELVSEQIHDLSYKNNDYHVMIYGEIVAVHKNK